MPAPTLKDLVSRIKALETAAVKLMAAQPKAAPKAKAPAAAARLVAVK